MKTIKMEKRKSQWIRIENINTFPTKMGESITIKGKTTSEIEAGVRQENNLLCQ